MLEKVYEPLFLSESYGYRPYRSVHDAIKQVMADTMKPSHGRIVDVDLRKYFDSVPWEPLMNILKEKISDRRFIGLITKQVKAPVIEMEKVMGIPQGSIPSPVLDNIYLHKVIDTCVKRLDENYFEEKFLALGSSGQRARKDGQGFV